MPRSTYLIARKSPYGRSLTYELERYPSFRAAAKAARRLTTRGPELHIVRERWLTSRSARRLVLTRERRVAARVRTG